ncbi:energy-coupling factor ABC transporter ATP-binding protein [Lentibacillus saliphilus]|uniref:energy-coupling factor ABC transporter ATP-binding protein n=1 Tax=Lentibacillus saliphilus TaxID=2737028 RepID=UPI001C2F378A|nr:energy-coupling factor ABC transporter ATP-binding protein [Lentibacillus saliphilus]
MDISFKNVSYTYQPNSPFAHQALDDVSFSIPSGTYVAVIGHTGSGKSTLIQHLNGLLRPTTGTVTIGDFVMSRTDKPKDMKALRSRVGVVFQYPEHQLFEETIAKDIAFGPKNFGVSDDVIKQRIDDILPTVGIHHDMLERSPFELSGGQMRRVAIAGVLAIKPEVLVLDEPTAGLDPRGQRDVMDMFYSLHKKEKMTTVLVTHNMEDAVKYADHIIILNQGKKYLEGKPETIFSDEDTLQQVQLDVPEVIQFLWKYEQKFGHSIPYNRQSITDIAQAIKEHIKEVGNDE